MSYCPQELTKAEDGEASSIWYNARYNFGNSTVSKTSPALPPCIEDGAKIKLTAQTGAGPFPTSHSSSLAFPQAEDGAEHTAPSEAGGSSAWPSSGNSPLLDPFPQVEDGAEHTALSEAGGAFARPSSGNSPLLAPFPQVEDGAEHTALSEAGGASAWTSSGTSPFLAPAEGEDGIETTPVQVWSQFSLDQAVAAYSSALERQSVHWVEAEQDAFCFDRSGSLTVEAISHHYRRVLSLTFESRPKGKKRRSRGGERHRYETGLAGGEGFLSKRIGLYLRAHRAGEAISNRRFCIARDGLYSDSGWQGRAPAIQDGAAITAAYRTGAMKQIIQDSFYPVHYDLRLPKPAFLLDQKSRTYGYRTTQCAWMEAADCEIYSAIDALLQPHLKNPRLAAECAGGSRGAHFPCIIGHYRQYTKAPTLTGFHSKNAEAVSVFNQTPIIRRINSFVSSLVLTIFPGVAVRFLESAEWHQERHGIRPLYGYFWNLCINGMFPGQRRISTVPHSDAKNVIGVCALLVYLIPGKKFDHRLKSWLVLWEAGVLVELPPWVVFLYPSSLLHHFNVDIGDFKFLLTDGERPTQENSRPLGGAGDEGRGSLVYFNQATMYHGAETGYSTLSEAKRAGLSGRVNSAEKAGMAFTQRLYG